MEQAGLTADTLLDRFGSIGCIFQTSDEALRAALPHDSRVADMLVSARTLAEIGQREQICRRAFDVNDRNLHKFLRLCLGARPRERLLALFLDRQDCIIRDEIICEGTQDHLEFRAAALFRRAFELEADSIVLAHNHTSGDPRPSERDVTLTRELSRLAQSLDVKLADHLIVTRKMTFSMRKAGLVRP